MDPCRYFPSAFYCVHKNSWAVPNPYPFKSYVFSIRLSDGSVPADENMINRGNNNSVEGNKNANGGAGDGAGGEDDDDDDDDNGDDERLARGIHSGGPFDCQSLVLDAKNA